MGKNTLQDSSYCYLVIDAIMWL